MVFGIDAAESQVLARKRPFTDWQDVLTKVAREPGTFNVRPPDFDLRRDAAAMAVALLTTLYGAVLANALFGPIADKLKLRAREEAMTKSLIIDALLAIQSGQNPRVIDSMLRTYLPESKREVADAG